MKKARCRSLRRAAGGIWGVSRIDQGDNKVNQNSKEGRKVNNEATKVPISIRTVRAEGLLPFIATIMDAHVLEKSTPPTFENYDGSTYPDDHLRDEVLHRQSMYCVPMRVWQGLEVVSALVLLEIEVVHLLEFAGSNCMTTNFNGLEVGRDLIGGSEGKRRKRPLVREETVGINEYLVREEAVAVDEALRSKEKRSLWCGSLMKKLSRESSWTRMEKRGNEDVDRNDAGEDVVNVLEAVADAGHEARSNWRKKWVVEK
ncbi:hypothetical protein LR48_Vigan08g038600 [Vigna angularis]|uniref:Uncharacterized protein n=1 Tax=Phaseolus angularis TaxID=3914 RepID=A0A0L9V4D6_PHAAN|nr:hypothetical protein LR48_Vigan08g038600 [Vigna angularis]